MVLTKNEIDADIYGKGDFVQLDHLKRFLGKADSMDVKKYILLKIADINEKHKFFSDAARSLDEAAEIAITYKEKIEIYSKMVKLLINSEQFDLADKAVLKSIAFSNTLREKSNLQDNYIKLYEDLADRLVSENKHRKAINVYNKLYSMPQNPEKKDFIKQKLLTLYLKLGKTKEHSYLSRPEPQPLPVEKKEDIMGEIGVKRWGVR
ncbi:MAG TPA: hypothetical protein P5277_01500 [Candidatus Paceibacterota bacterium]|nr:hypothetical protein [Candidatus Paceibacterota bacterium]